jgi:hypothetical protein
MSTLKVLMLVTFFFAASAFASDLRGCPRNDPQTATLIYTPAADANSQGTCNWVGIPDLTDWLDGFADTVNATMLAIPEAARSVVSDRGGVSQEIFISLLQQKYRQRLEGQLKEINLIDACLQGQAPTGGNLEAQEFRSLSSRCPALITALADKASALGPRMVDLSIQNKIIENIGMSPLSGTGDRRGCLYDVDRACTGLRVLSTDPAIIEQHESACRAVYPRECSPDRVMEAIGTVSHSYSSVDLTGSLTEESLRKNLAEINSRLDEERPLNQTAQSYLGDVIYDRETVAPRLRQQNQQQYNDLFLQMPLLSQLSNYNSPLSDNQAKQQWIQGLATLRSGVQELKAKNLNPTQLGALGPDIQAVINENPRLCAEAYALVNYSRNQEGWNQAIDATVDIGSALGCFALGWSGVGAISCAVAGVAMTATDLIQTNNARSQANAEVFSSIGPIQPEKLDSLIDAQAQWRETVMFAPLAAFDLATIRSAGVAARAVADLPSLKAINDVPPPALISNSPPATPVIAAIPATGPPVGTTDEAISKVLASRNASSQDDFIDRWLRPNGSDSDNLALLPAGRGSSLEEIRLASEAKDRILSGAIPDSRSAGIQQNVALNRNLGREPTGYDVNGIPYYRKDGQTSYYRAIVIDPSTDSGRKIMNRILGEEGIETGRTRVQRGLMERPTGNVGDGLSLLPGSARANDFDRVVEYAGVQAGSNGFAFPRDADVVGVGTSSEVATVAAATAKGDGKNFVFLIEIVPSADRRVIDTTTLFESRGIQSKYPTVYGNGGREIGMVGDIRPEEIINGMILPVN